MDATGYKDQGNAAFATKDFPAAVAAFTKAIELDASNHVLYSNRSASFASLKDYTNALVDAQHCVHLNPSWGKGYVRLGAANHGLRKFDEAVAAYKQGLQQEPSNATLKESLEALEKERASSSNPFAKVFGPNTFHRVQTNPKLAPFLLQPDFVSMLSQVVANPSLIQMYLKDPRMIKVFMELSGITMPEDDEEDMPKQKSSPSQQQPPKQQPPQSSAAEAVKHKERGNAFYKEKKFDEALTCYREALDADPKNTTYLLNATAVHFEKGDYDSCIDECNKALEHAKVHNGGYQTQGRIMTRHAACLQKQKKHAEAILMFKQALLEDRNADTLAKLQACEKEKKVLDEEAFLDPELAVKKKEEGNAFFKAENYPSAVECYSEAIKRNPKEHTIYSNRAATYLKLCAYEEALKDCEKCLAIKPDFVKAISRKGHAYFWTKQYHRALQTYDEGLKLEPDNADCKDGRMRTFAKIQELSNSEGDDDVAKRAMADPEIASIMKDSYMQMVLGEMQKNPARINEYMRDPGIAAKINKLIAAGIIRTGSGTSKGGH